MQPALERVAVSGGGAASRSSVAPTLRELAQLEQRAGDAGHRDVARGVRRARPRPPRRARHRRRAARSRSRAASASRGPSARYSPSSAERGDELVARSRGRRAAAARGPRRAEGRERRGAAQRQVPAGHRTPSRSAARARPSSVAGVLAVGADQRVDQPERAPAHGADVGDVRHHGRGAGTERVARTKAGAIASPPSTRCSPSRGMRAASSPSMPGSFAATSARSRFALRPGRCGPRRRAGPVRTRNGEWTDTAAARPTAAERRAPGIRAGTARQGAAAVDVDWRPPAGGDARHRRRARRLWGEPRRPRRGCECGRGARIEGARPRRADRRAGRRCRRRPGRPHAAALRAADRVARVCDPQRRALLAACVFEGWAADRARPAS